MDFLHTAEAVLNREALVGSLSRNELRRRLEELARSEPPHDLSPGAMCYRMVGPPEVAEYLCPVCGQKTLYALEAERKTVWSRLGELLQPGQNAESKAQLPPSDAATTRRVARDDAGWDITGLVEFGLPHFRRQMAECGAAEQGIALDESQFCEQCRPGVTAPKLALAVHNEAREHRVEGIDGTDVQLLAEFLEGKKKHIGGFGRETPLKEHAARLAELLGFEPPA